jgi:hypothetical protein
MGFGIIGRPLKICLRKEVILFNNQFIVKTTFNESVGLNCIKYI